MDRVGNIEGWILLALAGIVMVLMTGCAGIGVKGELYRIDERQESQKTNAVPLKCLFVECGGLEK